MPSYVWDKEGETWVESDQFHAKRLQIVPDIDPYVSVTGERIGSRREHREFLKRGGYQELGNEKPPITRGREHIKVPDARNDIRRAVNDLKYGMAPTRAQLLDMQRRMKYE